MVIQGQCLCVDKLWWYTFWTVWTHTEAIARGAQWKNYFENFPQINRETSLTDLFPVNMQARLGLFCFPEQLFYVKLWTDIFCVLWAVESCFWSYSTSLWYIPFWMQKVWLIWLNDLSFCFRIKWLLSRVPLESLIKADVWKTIAILSETSLLSFYCKKFEKLMFNEMVRWILYIENDLVESI